MDPTSLLVAVVWLTDEKKPGTGNICTYHDASTVSPWCRAGSGGPVSLGGCAVCTIGWLL